MSINIFKLYIYNFCIIYICCYISLPLNINDKDCFKKISSLENLEEDDLSLILYNKIALGEPKQNVIFIISPEEYNFYMVTSRNNNNIKDTTFYYDFRISKTNNINIDENNPNTNVCFMSEKFFFDNKDVNRENIKEIAAENINLVLYFQKPVFLRYPNFCSNFNSYIIFGLKLSEGFDKMEYSLNLIRQLKKKNVAKNYKWFINYNNTYSENDIMTYSDFFCDINMVIGIELHELFPNEYQERNLRLINSKSLNGYINWGLYFTKIYYCQNNKFRRKILYELNNNANNNNTNLEEYLIADIKHDFKFIISPQIFFDSINKHVFDKLFKEKKCFIGGNKYKYIYCDNTKDIEEYIKNNFKTIFFNNQELNYEFILEYQDLFVKSNNKILFLIITKKDAKRWTFGIPFLKKYILTYDYDNRVIGFYRQFKRRYFRRGIFFKYNIIKIIFFIFLTLVFGILAFFIGRHIFGYKRKKRLNELQENYKYEEKDEENENNNINDYTRNTNQDKLIELEMEKL